MPWDFFVGKGMMFKWQNGMAICHLWALMNTGLSPLYATSLVGRENSLVALGCERWAGHIAATEPGGETVSFVSGF